MLLLLLIALLVLATADIDTVRPQASSHQRYMQGNTTDPAHRPESRYKLPVFYIYINKYNRSDDAFPQYLLDMFEDVQRHLGARVNVAPHNYNSLLPLVREYDAQLGYYFTLINPMYAAMLANIGRAVLLYLHSGVYHDIKMRFASMNVIRDVSSLCTQPQRFVIFELNPERRSRVRNTNIVACRPHSKMLAAYIDGMKQELQRMVSQRSQSRYNWFGTKVLLDLIEKNSSCKSFEPSPASRNNSRLRRHEKDTITCDFGEESFLCRHFRLVRYDTKKEYNEGGTTHWSNLTIPLLLFPEDASPSAQ